MANNQSIKNYYNSRINDFRKKVSRGIIPLDDKEKIFRCLQQLSEVASNYSTNQFNEMLEKIETMYSKFQVNFNSRIKSLNVYLKKHKSLPVYSDKITSFEDGMIMSDFIFKNLNYLEKLYSESNVLTKILKGYRLDKRQPHLITSKKTLPFLIKVRFVFKYLSEYFCLPIEYDINFKFPDGESVFEWLKENKNELNNSSDYRAKAILNYYDYYNNQAFQNKLKYVYNYLLENDELPKASDKKIKFPDGTLVGSWVHYHIEKIRKLKDFVKSAKTISDYLDFVMSKGIYNIRFYSQMLEVYNYLKENTELPEFDNTIVRLKDGTFMGEWILCNREKLQHLDDIYALAIVTYLEKCGIELQKKRLLTVDERITEVYKYLLENGCLPKYNDEIVKFSDSVIMGRWLSHNKKKIKEMVQDERAIMITQYYDGVNLCRETSSKQGAAVFEHSLVSKKCDKVKKLDIK